MGFSLFKDVVRMISLEGLRVMRVTLWLGLAIHGVEFVMYECLVFAKYCAWVLLLVMKFEPALYDHTLTGVFL